MYMMYQQNPLQKSEIEGWILALVSFIETGNKHNPSFLYRLAWTCWLHLTASPVSVPYAAPNRFPAAAGRMAQRCRPNLFIMKGMI